MGAALVLQLLAIAGGIGIHVEAAENVTQDEVLRLASTLGEMTRTWAGDPHVAVDDLVWSDCSRRDRCVSDIRTRLSAEEILILGFQGGPTRIRLLAELIPPDGEARRLSLDLPRAPDAWKDALAPLVQDFFRRVPLPAPPPATAGPRPGPDPITAEHRVSPRPRPWPWLFLGTSAILAGTGLVFGLARNSALDAATTGDHSIREAIELRDRANQRALVADVLFGAAIAGAGAAISFWLAD